jgi:hypothetical protein
VTVDLSGAWLKVSAADTHISQLEDLVKDYNEEVKPQVVSVPEPGTNLLSARIQGTPKALPPKTSVLVGDGVHNLRTALDHLACQLVGQATDGTGFPIPKKGGTPGPAKFERDVRRRLKGARPEVIAAVVSMQPYEGGVGHRLWTLHRVDITDKHVSHIIAAFDQRSVIWDVGGMFRHLSRQTGSEWLSDTPSWDIALKSEPIPLTAGAELFRAPPEWFTPDYRLRFAFELRFRNPEPVRGLPVLTAMREWRQITVETIERLAALG